MSHYKKDYHDLRKPYPDQYASGFGLPRHAPYLRRPEHPLVVFSYEFMRLCACIGLVLALVAIAVALFA